jgi:hypothetical protein
MNLGVALAECRSGRAPSGSDGSRTVGYGWLSFPLQLAVFVLFYAFYSPAPLRARHVIATMNRTSDQAMKPDQDLSG